MKAYVDGSSTGLYGYEITTPRKERSLVRDHPMTNNQAEWLALVHLLMNLEPRTKLTIFSDSQIVVNQLIGAWETRDKEMRHLKGVARELIEIKELNVKMIWIPRKQNVFGWYLDKIMKHRRKKRRKRRERIRRGYN